MSSVSRSASRVRLPLLVLLLVAATSCIFRRVDPVPVTATAEQSVAAPTRVHLIDGSTVLFATGFRSDGVHLRGAGVRYDVSLAVEDSVGEVPLDSVAGAEVVTGRVNTGATIAGSLLGVVATTMATAGLMVAIFGSCPTIYYDSAGTAVLEAESFSYSIAPMFAARDVDRLRVAAGADGIVRLEIRNEALETHYIDALELLEVRHTRGERIVPDARGVPIAAVGLVAPVTARDRAGRRLESVLAAADGDAAGSADSVIAAAVAGDLEDFVELTFPHPGGSDSTALVLRLRNSLLNTVLFYDMMLADRGALAMDWLHDDLAQIAPALELGQWYTNRLGMRVEVLEAGEWREIARVRDVGPIAWKEIGVLVPATGSDSLRMRLAFVADNWRIDQAALATSARRPDVVTHQLARIVLPDGSPHAEALANARAPDGEHLVTWPRHWFSAEWDVGAAEPGESRTFLLAAQGYYVEWMRQQWLRREPAAAAFQPSDAVVEDALRRWQLARPGMESQFMASRLPVR